MMANRQAIGTEYLIIGNSAGAIGAAEALREVDRHGVLTMVSDEPYPAYCRPLLAKYLAGERTVDEMLFRPADFYAQNDITLLSGNRVKRLELDSRVAHLESGEQITWNKLLLATGGVPIVPKMGGVDKKGVFTFLTLEDAQAIASFARNAGRAVVVGGGLIGISVTEALTKLGIGVTIVEMKDRVLNTILDEEASSIAEENLRQAGVAVITNHTVSEISGQAFTEGVVLDSGEGIPCDLVVIAIGVLPRTELTLNTEIRVNRGIVVDRYMSTSYPGVYSCGDAVEAYDFVYAANRVTPIWLNAYIGGRIAGHNMAGIRTEYRGGTTMNALSYFGLDIAAAGAVTPSDETNCEVISRRQDGIYRKVVLRDDVVTGMVFVREIEKSGIVFGLMRDRTNVSSFKQGLLADDFGLAYFPEELRRERLRTPGSGAGSRSAALGEVERLVSGE